MSAAQYSGWLLVSKVDTDQNPEWAERFRVRSIPTLLFVSGGRVVKQQVGALSSESFREMADHFLDTARLAVKFVHG